MLSLSITSINVSMYVGAEGIDGWRWIDVFGVSPGPVLRNLNSLSDRPPEGVESDLNEPHHAPGVSQMESSVNLITAPEIGC